MKKEIRSIQYYNFKTNIIYYIILKLELVSLEDFKITIIPYFRKERLIYKRF